MVEPTTPLCPSKQEFIAMVSRRSLFATLGLALGLTAVTAAAEAQTTTTPKKKTVTPKKKTTPKKKPAPKPVG